ncbi:hypothetical protein NKJ54_32290 [Mesorhizobium sp. M0098]
MTENTNKMGTMDEERRTVKLKEAIRAAKDCVVFINTGFLDFRLQDLECRYRAGCGLAGHAQIGKGVWAMPRRVGGDVGRKDCPPKAGANTAWVPSPIAATLHATHCHNPMVRGIHFERCGNQTTCRIICCVRRRMLATFQTTARCAVHISTADAF